MNSKLTRMIGLSLLSIPTDGEPAAGGAAPAPAAPKAKKTTAKKPAAKGKAAKKPAAKKPAKKPAKKAKAKDGEAAAKGPGALREYAPNYVKDKEHKTASGNVSVSCGDETAQKLVGKTIDEVYKMAAKITEEAEADLRKRYKHLNLGMQRMNLGNKIRGVLNAK